MLEEEKSSTYLTRSIKMSPLSGIYNLGASFRLNFHDDLIAFILSGSNQNSALVGIIG